MTRIIFFLYGLIAYTIFFGSFLYAIGFMGNFIVPKSLDSGVAEGTVYQALFINMLLLVIFAIQHSVMARPSFKKWWTKIVPQAIERSTYVLFSSLLLILLFILWQPIGGIIWNVQDSIWQNIIYSLFALGWLLVLMSTFLINHFDLFGLRQVYFYLLGKEYTEIGFVSPGLYKYTRHPLYLGWLLAFWATPTMTIAHLVFAIVTTVYILIAIQFEERDLMNILGKSYADYRQKVPMLIPFFKKIF